MREQSTTHQCPGRDHHGARCHHQVPFHRFACNAHWFVIPNRLRNRLSREWDEHPGEDSYFIARAECLAAVGVPVNEIADENGGVPLTFSEAS